MSETKVIRLIYFVMSITWLNSCAINPVSQQVDFVLMSETEEIELGKSYHEQFVEVNHIYDDPDLQHYVNSIGQNIASLSHRSNLDYHITVIDSPEVNAFALPGGYIYVTRGILAYLNSEAELAAVLGHEIGHIAARHAVQKATQQKTQEFLGRALFNHLGFGIDKSYNRIADAKLQVYSKQFELEADKLAVEYLVRSGYAPNAMSRVISTIKGKEELVTRLSSTTNTDATIYHGFNSHPDTLKRLKLVKTDVQQLNEEFPKGRDTHHIDYLKHIKGLVYGSSAQGQVIDGHYLNATYRIGIKVPDGWSVNNDSKILQLVSPDPDGAVIQILSKPHDEDISPQTQLHRLLLSDELNNEKALVNGQLQGWMATSTKQTVSGEIPVWLATWVNQDLVWVIVATATDREKYHQAIMHCLQSFYRIGDEEFQLLQPKTIDLLRVRQQTSYQQLATNSPLGVNAEEQLRLINGQTNPQTKPAINSLIKIVR